MFQSRQSILLLDQGSKQNPPHQYENTFSKITLIQPLLPNLENHQMCYNHKERKKPYYTKRIPTNQSLPIHKKDSRDNYLTQAL